MNRNELKQSIISLGLIKTKKQQKRFNNIQGVNSFRHATAGIQMKNIKTSEDVIDAWNKYNEMEDASDRVEESIKKRIHIINKTFVDDGSKAYNNSADDL